MHGIAHARVEQQVKHKERYSQQLPHGSYVSYKSTPLISYKTMEF
jgi:hypothetical protein